MISDRFKTEIKRSHEAVSYVDVVGHDRRVIRLTATDGSVRVDRSNKIRRSCSVTCLDPEGVITPTGPESVLTPFGTVIRPYRGVRYDDGTEELYPLGVFHLSRSSVSDDSMEGLSITLDGFDFSRRIQRDKFREVYTIPAGTNVIDAIEVLVERTLPEVVYDMVSSTVTVASALVYDVDDDPWTAVSELALSAGCDAYFAADGRFVVAPSHAVGALPSPVFEYVDGENGTLLSMVQEFNDDPGYNGVIVTAESAANDETPIRIEVWDEDPASPTYYLGPYGKHPQHYTDRNVTTIGQAQAVGLQLLQQHLGFVASLDVTSLVHPGLESGDIVRVGRRHIDDRFSVESFTIPLSAGGTQSLDLRGRK